MCLLNDKGKIITWTPMFAQEARRGNELDITLTMKWISSCRRQAEDSVRGAQGKLVVCLEEPGGAQSYRAAVSMEGCFHSLRAILELMRLPYTRITPQSWQKAMLGKIPKGKTKDYALRKARIVWPDEQWLASARCRTAHNGGVDAALIALHSLYHQ